MRAVCWYNEWREKRKRKRRSLKRKIKNMGFMDKVLIIMGTFLLLFIIGMIVIYLIKGDVPYSVVDGVFGMCKFEGGFMAAIKMTKVWRTEVAKTKKREQVIDETPDLIEPEDPPIDA